VTANVLLKLDPHDPQGFIRRWKTERGERPFPKLRYWIIINDQVAPPPKTVQARWPDVAELSISTAIRSATQAEVRRLVAEAEYANAVECTDIEVRVVAIPDDWRRPIEGEFQQETMRSLTELGRRLDADPLSWMLRTAPSRSCSPEPAHGRVLKTEGALEGS
jgi:hypothetical protein